MHDLPALLGGTPVRPEGPPGWPLPDADVTAAVASAMASGAWGQYHGEHVCALEVELAAFHGELLLNRRKAGNAFVKHIFGCRVDPVIQNERYRDTLAYVGSTGRSKAEINEKFLIFVPDLPAQAVFLKDHLRFGHEVLAIKTKRLGSRCKITTA